MKDFQPQIVYFSKES